MPALYKCKFNQRKCKVPGCESTEFYSSCYNCCKTHKKEFKKQNIKEKQTRFYKALLNKKNTTTN